MEDLIAQDNAEYEEGESVTKTIPILIKIIENVHAKNLAYQLVLPHIENRLCNKTLLRSLRSSMMTVILVESCGREKTQTRVSHQSSTHKTCGICARLANKKGVVRERYAQSIENRYVPIVQIWVFESQYH